MRSTRSVPPCIVIPVLIYPDPGAAADWLSKAFAQSPRPPMPLSTLQETPRDVPSKTRGQDGFATSFPVGLLHPLQHAGLSRRSPSFPLCLDSSPYYALASFFCTIQQPRVSPQGAGQIVPKEAKWLTEKGGRSQSGLSRC